MQHGRHSPFKGKLKNPTFSSKLENPLCGDEIRIEIRLEKDQVVEIGFTGDGCLISQAAASLLVGEAKKVRNLSKIKKFNQETVLELLGIKLTLSRIQCAMLSVEVLREIVGYSSSSTKSAKVG